MSRLIDAVWVEEKLKKALDVVANNMTDAIMSEDEEIILAANNQHSAYATALTILKHAPTIEAVPVVETEWIKEEGAFFPRYKCSVCRAKHGAIWFKYCPSCGAKMKGGAK